MNLLTLAVSVALAACASDGRESTVNAPDAEVRAAVQRIIAADNARDLEAAVDCYSTDAEWMPPLEAAVVGREALRARYASMFKAFQPEITCTVEETWRLCGTAVARGRTAGRLVSIPGGDVRTLDDKFLMILRLEPDGIWRIQRLMWNANRHD